VKGAPPRRPEMLGDVHESAAEQAATLDTIRKFIFSFVFRAATRLRFDLKEKKWLSEMENGERGHLNTFAH
jgi:hypothetical protein